MSEIRKINNTQAEKEPQKRQKFEPKSLKLLSHALFYLPNGRFTRSHKNTYRKDQPMKTVTLTLSALLIAGTAYAAPVDFQSKTLLKDFNSSRTADSR